jgi:crossover junction endodeoxyribonuclease RuvC
MADADADARAGRPVVVSTGTPHPVLSSLDEARPQAGARREHRSKTSFHPNYVRCASSIELGRSYEETRTLSRGSNESGRTADVRTTGAATMRVMITLGIDPGTAICGFGVVSLGDGRLRLVDAGVIRTSSNDDDAGRLRLLHAALGELLDRHRPARVGVERLFFQRNVQTAMAVGQARGVALLAAAAAQVPIDEPTPNEVKQAVCGNGSADKQQVAAMVGRLLGISLAGVPDDATDALAVAIGSAYRAASEPKAVIG